MPTQDQLEIISPTGEVRFFDLDPTKGVTNIGRHPENDVVIESPRVAPFHAMLDHRQKPYQIIIMSEEGEAIFKGQPLSPNVATPLEAYDTVEVDGYAMMLLESEGAATAPVSQAPLAAPAETVSAAPAVLAPAPEERAAAPETVPVTAAAPEGLKTRPADLYDEVIVTELSEQEWTIDVEQTATCDLTITNGGGIVATFEVKVEGVDASWTEISQPQVNLFEGQQARVAISVTPPRLTSSRAGAHHLAVVVTSPNHPGRQSQRGGTLTINPYYEFAVGELSPKQQTVSWRDNTGELILPIANQGNSLAPFRVDAEDTERACGFEFEVPGQAASLARQADMRLPPEETFAIPIRVTPHRRRLVGLRKRQYSFTVTASMLEGALAPRSVMGQLSSKPLIGPGLLALIILTLAVLILIFFRPKIYEFGSDAPLVAGERRILIRAGEPVTLRWRASPFTYLRLDPDVGSVEGPLGQQIVAPADDTLFTLRAENLLSRLVPLRLDVEQQFRVEVEPVEPEISLFLTKKTIVKGESAKLVWEVADADQFTIFVEPPADFGDRIPVNSGEFSGEYDISPNVKTRYTLQAANTKSNTEASESEEVDVLEPTATPVPTPVIEVFEAEPARIVVGDEVLLRWSVQGDPDVELNVLGPVEPVGAVPYKPPVDGVVQFLLRAFVENVEARQFRTVVVDPAPTATPEPLLPQIQDFRVQPDEVVLGDPIPVQLFWLVSGDVRDIQIGGPGFGPVTNLAKEGSLPINAEESTFFILTAFGESEGQIASETVELTVLEPTPIPTGTPLPTPTATPWPLPIILYFRVETQPGTVSFTGGDPPTYAVVVGTRIQLNWQVQNAVRVTLEGFGDEPATGNETVDVFESKNYHLSAENVQGAVVDAFLRVELQEPPPPSPPFGLNGIQGSSSITLTWSYPSQNISDITGFRIYRAPVPPGNNFAPVATLNFPLDTYRWVDTDLPICGKAYYVVALYFDVLNSVERETDSSTSSWLTSPCPTPTP